MPVLDVSAGNEPPSLSAGLGFSEEDLNPVLDVADPDDLIYDLFFKRRRDKLSKVELMQRLTRLTELVEGVRATKFAAPVFGAVTEKES